MQDIAPSAPNLPETKALGQERLFLILFSLFVLVCTTPSSLRSKCPDCLRMPLRHIHFPLEASENEWPRLFGFVLSIYNHNRLYLQHEFLAKLHRHTLYVSYLIQI